jgi:hypothetical protein
MSAAQTPDMAPEPQISLEDIRHKALKIRSDISEEVQEQVTTRGNQIVLAGVVAVVAVISIAYFVGMRAGRRALESQVY